MIPLACTKRTHTLPVVMKVFFALVLFALQSCLILTGASLLGMYISPFVLLLVSVLLLVLYLHTLYGNAHAVAATPVAGVGSRLLGALIGLGSIVLLHPIFNNVFNLFPDPSVASDVIPQLEALYQRNSKGLQPYYPLEQFSWHPFPVYMPLHWLPVGIGYWLHTDVRWVGVMFMALACGVWGYKTWGNNRYALRVLAICLPALGTIAYLLLVHHDMSVSFEVIIAAYYLLLALGLYYGSLFWIVAGIIACLLSRYTLLFWLPLMAILMWRGGVRRHTLIAIGTVVLAVVVLYVLPFYARNPSILADGVKYHNHCYIAFWEGMGDPDAKLVYDKGLNFAYYERAYLPGSIEERLTQARMIQAVLMLLLLVLGIWLQTRWKDKMHYTHLGLGMLYAFILVFFMSSPYTFVYYYISLTTLSAVLCAAIMLHSNTRQAQN